MKTNTHTQTKDESLYRTLYQLQESEIYSKWIESEPLAIKCKDGYTWIVVTEQPNNGCFEIIRFFKHFSDWQVSRDHFCKNVKELSTQLLNY